MTVDQRSGVGTAYPPEPWHLHGTMHVSLSTTLDVRLRFGAPAGGG